MKKFRISTLLNISFGRVRVPLIIVALLVATIIMNIGAVQQPVYELSNDFIRLAIDSRGNLVRLENAKTGHNYISVPGRELWRMYYRTSDARELEIPADKQKAEVSRKSNMINIKYSGLTGNVALMGSTRQLKINFTLSAELQNDQINWTATIQNNETEPELEISELWVPWIYGIGDLGKGLKHETGGGQIHFVPCTSFS